MGGLMARLRRGAQRLANRASRVRGRNIIARAARSIGRRAGGRGG